MKHEHTTNHTTTPPYDYWETVKEDVKNYITENYTTEQIIEELKDSHEWMTKLHEELWTEDSVTGNASGSYTFSTWKAEENLCHNLSLLKETLTEFGVDYGAALEKGAEFCDVSIRCYLLYDAICYVVQDIQNELKNKIYINGKKANSGDFETLKKWTQEGKTIAKATTDKNGNIQIITKD